MTEAYRPFKELLEDRDKWRDLALKRKAVIDELEVELGKSRTPLSVAEYE